MTVWSLSGCYTCPRCRSIHPPLLFPQAPDITLLFCSWLALSLRPESPPFSAFPLYSAQVCLMSPYPPRPLSELVANIFSLPPFPVRAASLSFLALRRIIRKRSRSSILSVRQVSPLIPFFLPERLRKFPRCPLRRVVYAVTSLAYEDYLAGCQPLSNSSFLQALLQRHRPSLPSFLDA